MVHRKGIGNAQQNTDAYLGRGMPYKFFQCHREEILLGVALKMLDDFVEDGSLFAGLQTYTHGVMADNDGHNRCNGEFKGAKAAAQRRERRQRGDGGGVATGHTAVTKEPLNAEFLGDKGVDEYL